MTVSSPRRLASPLVTAPPRPPWPRAVFGAVLLSAGVSLLVSRHGLELPVGLVPMLGFVAGLALAWSPLDDVIGLDPRRPRLGSVNGSDGWARLGLGVLLAGAALWWFARWEFTDNAVLRAVVLPLVLVAGVALLFAPWWLRLVRQVAVERDQRIREFERAEIAAHLHDSVLQTLTLIRTKADDPDAVARLARAQERDLRSYLYTERRSAADSVAAALTAAINEVEDAHGVVIELVTVGDAPTGPALAAAVAAAREAAANAARHGRQPITVYAELEPREYRVYVRDSGPGFNPKRVPADRMGIRESIVGRVVRHGGEAVVSSARGARTEVSIVVPREGHERQG